jgi:hypothetical protein
VFVRERERERERGVCDICGVTGRYGMHIRTNVCMHVLA